MDSRRRVLVWDLPTRIFHWLLVIGFLSAACIALLTDDESSIFPFHAIIGLTVALLVASRLVWGLVGTRYARFSSFAFGVGSVMEYLRSLSAANGKKHTGHNPASAWVIFAMLVIVMALVSTGVVLARGKESLKEFHGVLAYLMLALTVLHVFGVAIHTFRHRDNIAASMVHGRKFAEQREAIASPRVMAAIVLVLLVGTWAWSLVRAYDGATHTLRIPLTGIALRIGETEDREGADAGRQHEHEHDRGREEADPDNH